MAVCVHAGCLPSIQTDRPAQQRIPGGLISGNRLVSAKLAESAAYTCVHRSCMVSATQCASCTVTLYDTLHTLLPCLLLARLTFGI